MFKNKILLALTALVLATTVATAQSITIDDARFNLAPGLSYGAGSNVAIPISLNGCFAQNNQFKWQLQTAAGANVAGATGTVNVFYATFINTVLPASLTPGSYRFVLSATTAGSVGDTTADFTVVANPLGVNAYAVPTDRNKILKDAYYYGRCDGLTRSTLQLQDSSRAGSVDSIEMIDNYRPSTDPFSIQKFTPNTSGIYTLQFHEAQVGLLYRDAYYTAIAKSINGNIVSTQAYHIINNAWDIAIGTVPKSSSIPSTCKGDTVILKIRLDNEQTILGNFPAALIVIDWNDGTSTLSQTYTACQIMALNGLIKHVYTKTVCNNNQPNFNITATVTNPFNIINGPGITGTCGPGAIGRTTARIFAAPKAKFKMDSVVCATGMFDTLKLINLSDPGQGYANSSTGGTGAGGCAQLAHFTWKIDNTIKLYETTTDHVETLKDTAYVFGNAPGYHDVTLYVSNKYLDDAPCPDDDTTMRVCVDTGSIQPLFMLDSAALGTNIKDSIIGCSPIIKLANSTRRTLCLDSTHLKYVWQVFNAVTGLPAVLNTDYSWVVSPTTTMSPTISINKTGKYNISLRVKGACDTSVAMIKYVEANSDANVFFTPGFDTVVNCGYNAPFIIDYNPATPMGATYKNTWFPAPLGVQIKDSVHYTYQASTAGSLTYKWTVTPGTSPVDWEFVNSTTNTDAYPQIQFKTKGLYKVVDTFKNSCATKTAVQYVNFQEQPVASVDKSSPGIADTICHAITTYNVTGFNIDTTKNKDVIISWSVDEVHPGGGFKRASDGFINPANGNLLTSNILTPTFTLGANDTLNSCSGGGYFRITMSVRPKNNLNCTSVGVSKTFYQLPCLKSNDTAINACNGNQFAYAIPQPIGTKFDWQVVAGGAILSGGSNGTNTDTLKNIATLNSAVYPFDYIKIRITPKLGICDGDPYILTVNVRPIPQTPTINMVHPTNNLGSICSGDTVHIDLLTSEPTDKFTWVSHTGTPKRITGNNSLANQPSPIVNTLLNAITPLLIDTATYIVTTVSQYGCIGASDSVKIIVTPGPPKAQIISNHTSLLLCDSSCINLIANDATSIGNGVWSFTAYPASPSTTITTSANGTQAQICGLNPVTYYTIYYTITPTAGGCGATKDSAYVVNYDSLSTPNAGNDTVICNVGAGITFNLNGSANKALNGAEYPVWSKSPTSVGTVINSNSLTTPYSINAPHIDTVILALSNNGVCANKYDTAIIRVYVPPSPGSITYSPAQPQPSDHYCQGSNVTFTANYDTAKNNIAWWYYIIKSTGILIDSSSAGSKNPFVINNVQENFQVSNVYKSKGWDYGCKDSTFSHDITIIVDSPSLAGKIKSADSILCVPGYVANLKLDSSRGSAVPTAGNPNLGWILSTTSATSGYGSIINVGASYSPNVYVTTWYKAIVQNGNCGPDTTKPFMVYIPNASNAANTGNDTAVCSVDTIRLIGNVPPSGIGYWKMITGPVNNSATPPGTYAGVTTFDPSNNFRTTQNPCVANIKLYGTYQFEWSIENQGCTGTRDTITIKNTPPLMPDTIYANKDTVCKGTLVNFTAKPTSGGSGVYAYTWEKSTNAGGLWTPVSQNANGYTFSADVTTLFRRRVKSDSCEVISNTIQIVVDQPILNNVITATPNVVCTNKTAPNIIGSTPTGGNGVSYNYSWYYGSNLDTANNTLTNANSTGINYTHPTNVTDTINFRRIVVSGKCTDTSKYATVTVNPDAKASFISLAASVNNTRCAPYNIASDIINNDKLNTTYNWYIDTIGGPRFLVNTGNQLSTYTIAKGLDSAKLTLIAISNNGCKPDSMSLWFYTSATPKADFIISADSGCASNTVNVTNFTFTNTTPNKNLFASQNWQLNSTSLTNYGNADFPVGASFQYAPSSTGLDTTYFITLTVNSQQCGSSQITKQIKVRTKPHVLFTAAPTYQCSDSSILFTNATIGNHLTYNWIFGDATNSTNRDTVTHAYHVTSLQTFIPKLIASNECASDSFTTPVVVAANTVTLNASISGGSNYSCNPGTFTFKSNSNGGTSYYWDFGDASQSAITTNGVDSATHTYTKAGTYTVTLYGITACNVKTTTLTVTIYGTPNANFSIAPNNTVCKGDTVTFNNLTDTATSYIWSFGSGLTNPTHTYASSGNYNVTLIATRNHTLPPSGLLQCVDTSTTQIVTVKDTMPASFTIAAIGASCLPYNVQFTNTTVVPTTNYITNWTFGEPTPQSGTMLNVVNHNYTALGQFNATLTITSTAGCKYIDSQKVVVAGPTGSWVHDTGYKCGATPVNFTVYGNSYTDSIIVDYGDGIARLPYAGNNTLSHTYANGGTYYPSITLKSINGCTYYIPAYGAVRVDYVKAQYTVNYPPPPLCGKTVVNFVNSSTMDQSPALQTTNWWIDGVLINTYNATQTFTSTALHTVKLQTISVSGCMDSVATTTINVKVNNIPAIQNINRQDTACVGQTIYYSANVLPSEDPIQSYTWGFANGTTSGNLTPSTIYGVPGNSYFDTLTVATAYCNATLVSKRLVINPTPIVSINPGRDTSICPNTSITFTANSTVLGTTYTWYSSTGAIGGLNTTTGATVTATPQDTTKYYVVGTIASTGCSDSASVNVGVVHPYTITITAKTNAICKGDSVYLTANTFPAGLTPNYTWSPANGLDTIHGSIVKAKPSVTTIYTVSAPAACPPSPSDTILVEVGDTLRTWFDADTIRLQGGSTYTLSPRFNLTSTELMNATYAWTTDNSTNILYTVENPLVTITDNVCYTLAAATRFGCKDTATLCIRAFCEASQVFIPNMFTPDGDKVNDYFYVTATGINKVVSFRVYNRWGAVVFERANFTPPPYKSATFNPSLAWDGTVKGIVAPTESYVYTCEVECANGTRYVYTGAVTLIK